MLRRCLLLALMAAIALTHVAPRLYRPPRNASRLPDGAWAPYVRFLQGVRTHTRPGDTIVIVTPPPRRDDGYAYIYYRGAYFLTGRTVLPPERLQRARYAAFWHVPPPAGMTPVWNGDEGVLVRR
jgi:hypothetical protein